MRPLVSTVTSLLPQSIQASTLPGNKAESVVGHALKGIGKLVFAAALDVIVNEVLKFLAQAGSVFKIINAN